MDDTRLRVEVAASAPAEVTLRMQGDIDIAAEEAIDTAYEQARAGAATRVVLDFGAVGYINSTGIALIVRVLAEARRDRREVVAVGLSDHYREIFRITRLSDYLTIVDAPAEAGAA
jgi:anti-anti-sigma factor